MVSKRQSKKRKSEKPGEFEREASRRFSELVKAFGEYAPEDLWALVYATASSPEARHCAMGVEIATIATIRAMSQSRSVKNTPPPSPNEIIQTVRRTMRECATPDDYLMENPTSIAKVRIGNDVFKYVPGTTERPIADISRALRLADAVDCRIMRKFKFGIINVVRVLVKYADFCVEHLEDVWLAAPDVELGDSASVPEAEILAGKALATMDPCDHISFTDDDLRALEWLSCPATSARMNNVVSGGPVERWLRYQSTEPHARDYWLPVSFVPIVLVNAVAALMNSLERDTTAREAIRVSFAAAVMKSLWRFTDLLRGAASQSVGKTPLIGNSIQWMMQMSPDTFIAISLALHDDIGANDPNSFACGVLKQQVGELREGQAVTVTIGEHYYARIHKGANIIPLVIFAGNSHLLVPQLHGHVCLTLEDLTWIAETAEDPQDFYRFCRDLAADDFPDSVGCEAINYWETWRSNGKSFWRGGITPDLLGLEPHLGRGEWEKAAKNSDTEEALIALDLPALRTAVHVQRHSNGSTEILFQGESSYNPSNGVHTAPPYGAFLLTTTHPPVAITTYLPDWEEGDGTRLLHSFGEGLYYAFAALGASWEQGHQNTEITGYKLSLDLRETQSAPITCQSVRKSNATSDICISGWFLNMEEILEHAQDDPAVVNVLTCDALRCMLHAGGVPTEHIVAITQQWREAPPFVSIEATTARTVLNHLPRPISIDTSESLAAERLLGNLLEQAQINPGEYAGDAAHRLIRDNLVPGVLKTLVGELARYRYDDVVGIAMTQLACIGDYLVFRQSDIVRSARSFDTEWDPHERLAELREEMLRLRQGNEILVEAATLNLDQIQGSEPLSTVKWQRLMALADVYRKLTILSEQLHYKVEPCIIQVSNLYEVTFETDCDAADSWLLNMRDMARSFATLHISPHGLDSDDKRASDNDLLSAAFLQTFGFEIPDLFTVLAVLAQWPNFESDVCIVRTTDEEALDWVCQNLVENTEQTRKRCKKAIEFLTVTKELLEADDWRPWQTQTRKSRLFVKPLLRSTPGELLFAPQYLLMTEAVYITYLKQGAIPWKETANSPLQAALAQKRADQNATFELELEDRLRESGYSVISRIKPGKHGRLGVPRLTTEIDIVCGFPGSDEIWLIEAKDPVSTYSVAETGRSLARFFGNKGATKNKKSYADQLARKEAELAPYVAQIAEKLGLHDADIEAYKLRTIFMARTIVPACYLTDAPYEVRALSSILAENDGRLILR